MLKNGFFKEFDIHYYETDKYQKCTPVKLLNYLEETAICHSKSIGLSVDKLQSMGLGWVLSRWCIKVDQYPRLSDKILVQTWPSGFERFMATREFIIRNSSDTVIARASSLWVLFDIVKRKPVRIPLEFGDAYNIFAKRAIDYSFGNLNLDFEMAYSSEFTVRRSDIDTNGHVNNASYVEWMLEAVPDEVYNICEPYSFEIAYKKETSGGVIISSSSKPFIQEDGSNMLMHCISDSNGTKLAIARTLWRKI